MCGVDYSEPKRTPLHKRTQRINHSNGCCTAHAFITDLCVHCVRRYASAECISGFCMHHWRCVMCVNATRIARPDKTGAKVQSMCINAAKHHAFEMTEWCTTNGAFEHICMEIVCCWWCCGPFRDKSVPEAVNNVRRLRFQKKKKKKKTTKCSSCPRKVLSQFAYFLARVLYVILFLLHVICLRIEIAYWRNAFECARFK